MPLTEYPTLSAALKAHALSSRPDHDGTKIVRHFQAKFPTATHAVLFVNQDMSSSQFGKWTVLAIGPDQIHKTPADVEGRHLYDLPSQHQYPVAYVRLIGG